MQLQWLPIGHHIHIAVSNDHRFGTDAVLLAHFARPQRGERACDLGTGCGILPFLWLRDHIPAFFTGVELQHEAVTLAQASVAANGWEQSVSLFRADLRDWAPLHPAAFDLVTCNPPYFPAGSGRLSHSAAARLARQEGVGCSFDEVCTAADRLLTDSGRFCFCHRPEQATRLLTTLVTHGFSPVRQVLVRQQADKKPFLLLIEAQKDVMTPVCDTVQWCLFENGHPSPLYQQIYAPILEEHDL